MIKMGKEDQRFGKNSTGEQVFVGKTRKTKGLTVGGEKKGVIREP